MEKEELTKSMRWRIADYMAEERLEEINLELDDVKVRDTFYTRYIKRVFDIVISLIACIVTLPLNILLGIGTLIDVGFPLFFTPEKRVTKFGKFVRKTSLDELLNFWNILKGDMSLIGPRPLVPEYYHRYNKRHIMRLAVRPGLECPLLKTNGHVWTWDEQFENDVWYVENVSFLTDCRMLLGLVRFAMDRKSAKARAVSARGTFMGYDENGKAINMDDVPQVYIDKVASEMDGTEEFILDKCERVAG